MADLPVKEQAFVHTLKATCGGGELRSATMDGQISSRLREGLELGPSRSNESSPPAAAYTDPEDLEFGPPKRRPKIYALVCTWKQSCVVPTKREGEFWMKVWKAWYEHQGWKVRSHDTGYFASKGSERHAIGLDEYDRDTKGRIK